MPRDGTVRLLIAVGLLLASGCDSATDRWIVQLDNADPKQRRAAVEALARGRADPEILVPAMSRATEDSDRVVRESAATALSDLGADAKLGLPALENMLNDPELSTRLAAALAIYKIDPQHQTYQPVVVEALRAGNGPIFLEVGRMGAEAAWAVPTLVKLTFHRQPAIRALAARALGQIGMATDEVLSALQRATRDQNVAVQNAARHALGLISPPGDRP